jgi:hypothetical protein
MAGARRPAPKIAATLSGAVRLGRAGLTRRSRATARSRHGPNCASATTQTPRVSRALGLRGGGTRGANLMPMRSIAMLVFLLLGCAGRATSSAEAGGGSLASGGTTGDAGAGATSVSGGAAGNASAGASAGGASASASGQGAVQCESACPSPLLGIQLAVMSSAGPGEVSGVQATLAGPVTVHLSCSSFAQTTSCFPTAGGPEGSYVLQVTAPGFAPVAVDATVMFTPAQGCGCGFATLEPSLVTLNPLR